MIRRHLVAVLAAGATAGLGVALGLALGGSPSTTTRTVTIASTTRPGRTTTHVQPVERVRTTVRTVTVPGPAAPVAATPASQGASPRARHRLQQFSGIGIRVLGTITVPGLGAMLRWTNSVGRFRLLFDRTGVAVDSPAHRGQIATPPLTYQQVTVNTPGHWTIQIG